MDHVEVQRCHSRCLRRSISGLRGLLALGLGSENCQSKVSRVSRLVGLKRKCVLSVVTVLSVVEAIGSTERNLVVRRKVKLRSRVDLVELRWMRRMSEPSLMRWERAGSVKKEP